MIKSLTPAEKRYFRIFIRGKTDRASKYIQLFEAIEGMSVLDESILKAKIYSGEPLESQKFSELKSYLYELILKCLQTFDEHTSVEFRLNHLLQSVAALYKRGFYDDCLENLHKASKIAHQYECFAHLLEIIRWKKQIAYTRIDVDFLDQQLDRLNAEEQHTLQQLGNMSEYKKSFFQVLTAIKKEAHARNEAQMADIRAVMSQPQFKSPELALSHKARVYYYRTLNLCHYAALEYTEFYESGKILIDLLEAAPHVLKESKSDYIASLSNIILACGLLKRYPEVRVNLEKLRNIAPLTVDDRRKVHRQYFNNKFALCIYTGEFEEAKREMHSCLQELELLPTHDLETHSFLIQYAVICFGCGDYDRCLDFLNQLLNQPRTVDREDLQSMARILLLLAHFEKGNLLLLESLLRSTSRFIKRKNRLYTIEKRIISCIGEAVRMPNSGERQQVFSKAQSDLKAQMGLPEVRAMMQIFDLLAWLESKNSGISFADAVKKAFERNK